MATVCETCGDVGYEHLLLSCDDCKCATHQYCLAEVLFDGSSLERWFCNQCPRKRGEVTHEESLHKASNHADSGSAACQASTTSVESTMEARPYRNHKSKSKRSHMRPVGNKTSTRDCNGPNISCASEKALHSCELISMEISKASNDENQQVDDEHSVRPINNNHDANRLPARINKINPEKPVEEFEPPGAAEQLNPPKDSNCISSGNLEIEYPKDCRLTPVLAAENQNEPSMLLDQANSSSLSETTLKQKVLREASDTAVELSGTVQNRVKDNPKKRRRLILLDDDYDGEEAADVQSEDFNHRADSSSLSETTLKKKVLPEASEKAVGLSGTLENCVKDNPRKRRQLILLDDADDGEEAADVQSEDLNHRADSSSSSETTLKQNVLLEVSGTAVELSGTVQKCVKDSPRKRRQIIVLDDDDDGEVAANVQSGDFNHRADSSSLSETTLKKNALLEASDTAVELPDTVRNCSEENSRKRREIILLDDDDDGEVAADVQSGDFNHRADSSSLSETTLKENTLLEASDTAVELPDTVQNCSEENSRKRRQLILLDDDDDGKEAADVQSGDFNHPSLECDGSLSKLRIDTEVCVEETVHTGELNDRNLSAAQLDILIPGSSEITQPVEKRRRYTLANEDDEDGEVIIGTSNSPKLTSETLVAKDDGLQSRIKLDSESANQQRRMLSQPIDEPIWSGLLKINNEVFVSLVAHMSSKACRPVWELSTSLQPVIEVIKLPQLEAWPKSWKVSGPTDGDIALYFFPPSMSPSKESDVLVEEIIDSGAAIKAVVGVAELLIFPSTILPEQYHVCQGKHYLWGVFKRREDESDKDILVEEQDASARAKEGEMQEHHFMDQQHALQCESPDHGSSAAKRAVHVDNQLLVKHNCEAQEGAMKSTMGEGLLSPGNDSSSVELNSPETRSNCFMQPRSDPKLHVPEEADHQEDEQSFTRPSTDLGPSATTVKLIDSAGAVPPTTHQLFGFVTARTPRAQQLIQEMVDEGALLFSVAEETATVGSRVGNDTEVQVHPTMQDRRQPIGFVPLDDDVASEACLELFPVRQEHNGWTPRVEASKEVDLDLSLSARSGAPLGSFL
ncbi:uncharacterized protein LOC124656237 [Lolium rigidum]|uniref:uncharacterized protein LOC124656237 n=1 Tax=Lolium rigidum TaxID=89674 RepID=UPI001F5C68E9|nr:uncharacterized protein LOC124656237 [Lolium rigidum]